MGIYKVQYETNEQSGSAYVEAETADMAGSVVAGAMVADVFVERELAEDEVLRTSFTGEPFPEGTMAVSLDRQTWLTVKLIAEQEGVRVFGLEDDKTAFDAAQVDDQPFDATGGQVMESSFSLAMGVAFTTRQRELLRMALETEIAKHDRSARHLTRLQAQALRPVRDELVELLGKLDD